MNAIVELGDNADPMEIAMFALHREQPTELGLLMQVEGGRYTGPDIMYLLTETVCRKLGRWEEK
jgi:hypothetical protein